MNPFEVLENVQKSYRQYAESFQNFSNAQIRSWIDQLIETGDYSRDVALTI